MDSTEPQVTTKNSLFSKPFKNRRIIPFFSLLCLFLLPIVLIATARRVKLFKKAAIPITSPITLPLLCVAEGNSIPVTPTGFVQECCPGLILCPPLPNLIGSRGTCRIACEGQRPPGDANKDGKVNFSDFFIFRNEFIGFLTGKTPQNLKSDFNNDDKIDLKDFFIWRKNFLRSL